MAFLDHVGQRQAVAAETAGNGDHEPYMRGNELMQRFLIPFVAPPQRERMLLLALEVGRGERGSDDLFVDAVEVRHRHLLLLRPSPSTSPACRHRSLETERSVTSSEFAPSDSQRT